MNGKLREITTMLKIEGAGKTKRQTINKIREQLEKICSKMGEDESEEDQAIMKTLDDLLEFLKEGPPPLEGSSPASDR